MVAIFVAPHIKAVLYPLRLLLSTHFPDLNPDPSDSMVYLEALCQSSVPLLTLALISHICV